MKRTHAHCISLAPTVYHREKHTFTFRTFMGAPFSEIDSDMRIPRFLDLHTRPSGLQKNYATTKWRQTMRRPRRSTTNKIPFETHNLKLCRSCSSDSSPVLQKKWVLHTIIPTNACRLLRNNVSIGHRSHTNLNVRTTRIAHKHHRLDSLQKKKRESTLRISSLHFFKSKTHTDANHPILSFVCCR